MKFQIHLPYHEDRYIIETECAEIIQSLKRLFGLYCRETTEPETATLQITRAGSQYTVSTDGFSTETDNPLSLLHNMMFTRKKIQPGIFALHAGGVCLNGKAFIFCAPTTTGKTTLTSYLTERGLGYISDDCVFVDMDNLTVYPFHNPIHLREGGYSVLKNLGLAPAGIEQADDRYIYTPGNLSPQEMELGKIIFIERTADTNAILPCEKSKLIQKLMLSPITTYPFSREYITFLNRLSDFCCCMQYCDMEYVLDQVMRG